MHTAPRRSIPHVIAGAALFLVAAHAVPEVTRAVLAVADRAQAVVLRALDGSAGDLPAPLGLVAVLFDEHAGSLALAFGVGFALAVAALALTLSRSGRAWGGFLALLFHPPVYRWVVVDLLVRGVCRTLAYVVDGLILALPASLLFFFGALLLHGLDSAARMALGLPMQTYFIEAYGQEHGESALHVLRDLTLAIAGFALFLRGWRGFRGLVVPIYRRDLEADFLERRDQSLRIR
jgi:hypothetical protein